MNSLWPSTRAAQETPPEPATEEAAGDVADPTRQAAPNDATADEHVNPPPAPAPPPSSSSSRGPHPPPQQQRSPKPPSYAPMPPPPPPNSNNPGRQQQQPQHSPNDSLSLMQLRRIVATVNQPEPAAYDFVYADVGPHAEEIDEWFVYQFWQWVRLNAAQKAFEWHWNHESGVKHAWDDADHDTRTRFIRAAIAGVQSNDAALRSASIGKLVYLVLGRWGDTAMSYATDEGSRSIASLPQLRAIRAGVECLASLGGLPVVWEALRNSFVAHWDAHELPRDSREYGGSNNYRSGDIQQGNTQEAQDELMNLMTIMYIAVQATLNDPEDMALAYGKLLELNPSLVDFMLLATSKLRWDDQNAMPHTQIFLLFWKSILLVLGGTKDVERIKEAMCQNSTRGKDKENITASPLDYHVFRQEITSKYPAYIPPQPLIPLEAENTSLLPPLPNVSTRNGFNGIIPQPPNVQMGGASILNQPVHIATPAPSPPPSPGVGGKGGKKQNYQTNQNFPFMYPPLDATSNSAGGKGMTGINDALVSRRWEGSDIPASILEAGQLFSSRVRMTRATQQLWEEREQFLQFERGWGADKDEDEDEIEDLDLDLDELTLEEKELLRELKAEDRQRKQRTPPGPEVDFGPEPDKLDGRDKQRLTSVEHFYRNALPHLQSMVIVLLRPILVNVTAIVAQQQAQMAAGMTGRGNNTNVNGGPGAHKPDAGGQGQSDEELEPSPEEIDAARTREITAKAMTGILLLLLKWLRLSHILKFEYLTQLLLDSNYLPLVLKLFAHQDIQQVVDSKMDRVENSFFQFCNLRSKFKDKTESDMEMEDEEDLDEGDIGGEDGQGHEQERDYESEDDAVPPPIKRERPTEDPPASQGEDGGASGDDQAATRPEAGPEVDELGRPVEPLPAEPITDFSRRNFFSLINYLRVMHKICKNKAHRNLLLVQYKSSAILKKSLRVPQPELRLYTLKLFKGQVPYCGRKWRQSNMRVITAVYLHCRPELRDEWLAGSDIDAEVDSALPLEQALRGLAHWRNVRRYPDCVVAAEGVRAAMREEQGDFFSRELEKLNWADMVDEGASEGDQGEGAWGC